MCWRRWRLLFGALSREMSLTLSSSVSFFHSCTLRALGPNTLPPMDITKRPVLISLREVDRKEILRLYVYVAYVQCVNSSVAVTPESLDISWASRTVELALCKRSSRREASFSTESFATDERKKIITFCRKLYTHFQRRWRDGGRMSRTCRQKLPASMDILWSWCPELAPQQWRLVASSSVVSPRAVPRVLVSQC